MVRRTQPPSKMRLPWSMVLLVASLSQSQAQWLLVNQLSFGYEDKINPQGTQSVPGFTLQGKPNNPEVLSDKIMLTPPAPGNQRGAVWSKAANPYTQWNADIEFRANGPERAGGNLNIWLARDGARTVGSNSIYTVGKFEGLALVIDQYGGSGGMLRGFLNDDDKDFSKQPSVDSLAFGHCAFAYRNLGRPSQIKMRQTESSFRVEIDDQLCFESAKIRMPAGYHHGISAASADSPDSFELFKLLVLTEQTQTAGKTSVHQQQQQQQQQQHQVPARGIFSDKTQDPVKEDPYDMQIPDQFPDSITSSAAQFADLHNRLQTVNHHLSSMFRQASQQVTVIEKRHSEMTATLGEIKSLLSKLDQVPELGRRLDELDRAMRTLRSDLTQSLRESENSIKYHVADKHDSLTGHIVLHKAPGHGGLILAIMGSQVLLLGGYIAYKRRKSTPKKYL